jgi:hypothetical protein
VYAVGAMTPTMLDLPRLILEIASNKTVVKQVLKII